MASQPSPRRRFQFRLRTLLIVVTLLALLCAYVGWQESIIRNRIALAQPQNGVVVAVGWLFKRDDIPLVRRWLGDKQYSTVMLDDSAATKDVMDKYRAAFPEAIVIRESDAAKAPRNGAPRPPIEPPKD